jgi:hypothetical protein
LTVFLRVFWNAARFKRYVETRAFIPVTAYTGIESVKAVLQEDGEFPATRDQLVKHQGWKVVDLSKDKRIHLSQILSQIPKKTYCSVQDVIVELQSHKYN